MKLIKYYKKYFSLFIVLVFFTECYCQISKPISLKDLTIPNAPAFTLLDYAPSTIDRPGTAKALSANLVSLADQGGIPKNFAIEAAPFWFFKNNLNVFRYYGIDEKSGKEKNIFSNARNASVSIGSISTDSGLNQSFNANYLAIGLRINPIRILPKSLATALWTTINNISNRQNQLSKPIINNCIRNYEVNTAEYDTCIARSLSLSFAKDSILLTYEDNLQKLIDIKPLFLLDIAGAGSWTFKNNNWDQNHRYKTGIWATIATNFPMSGISDLTKMLSNKNYINIYALARYINADTTIDFKQFSTQHFFDFGGRFELEFNQLSLSFESVHRFSQDAEGFNSNRNVGIIQFKLNDHFYVSGTFGKNFGNVNNLIAIFGLNLGFGKQSITDVRN
jgi:hypothetical protein